MFGYLTDYLVWTVLLASIGLNTFCFFKLYPRKRRRLSGLILGNLLVFLTLAGGVAWVAETYFRFLSISTDSFGITLPAIRWFHAYAHLNSLQFRDREWAPQPPDDVWRIAFVGDSFLYGWGVERAEDRVSERVAHELLGRFGRRVESMNIAQPGWDTGDQAAALDELLNTYRVNEVVLCYVVNDIERLLPTPAGTDPKTPPSCRWFDTDSSALMEVLYYRVYLPYVPSVRSYHDWLADGYADPTIWTAQEGRLAALIDACHKRGIGIRVALWPFLKTGGTRFDPARIHAQLAGYFRSKDVPVLDLRPIFAEEKGDWTVSAFDAHPNAQAHARAARAIVEALFAPS